ncbi:class I adenylate-forming enzyme family protein [Phenylobacterium sp.]|uniref:class I adenylate-forming enzyme family protein n=1 Tax=Phenylobacterium sp. TaxID=1871053 RepID=UPI0035B23CDC
MNIAASLTNAAATYGASPALLTLDGAVLTYAALERRARAVAANLSGRLSLRPGERIGLAMSNDPAFFELLFGAWHAGLCVAPMNPRLHPREFAFLLEDCDAGVCFATPDVEPALRDEARCRVIAVGSAEHLALRDADLPIASQDVEPLTPAWLFYTSGTTGRPKGAILTHRSLNAMIDSFLIDSGAARDDAMLHLAPLSHAGGLLGLAYVRQALPQVILPQGALSADQLDQALALAGRASFFAVPTLVRRLMDPALLRADLIPHIQRLMFGGAPMYAEDLRAAINHFGAERLWGGYGQGEAPCTIAHLPSRLLGDTARPDRDQVLASVGVARSGVEIAVAGDDGLALAPDQIGEVLVRGDVLMTGYWSNPEASAAALKDGWLRTGDLGRLSEAGLLTLVDRSKDMLISGGSNIYPREIEEVLLTHPLVAEAAIVGQPDEEWGEIPVAFVVAADGLGSDELDRHCLTQLARYKRPKAYRFVPALPKSSYGKVLKSELRSMLSRPDDVSTPHESDAHAPH